MYKRKYDGTLKERWKQAHEAFKAKFETNKEYLDYCKIASKRYRNKYKAPQLTKEQKEFLKKENSRNFLAADPKRALWLRAKYRAGFQNVNFTLTPNDFEVPTLCPLLGIPIIIYHKVGEVDRDSSPSLDRIDNTKGYTSDNVRIISFKANRAKSNLTIEELNSFCENWKKYSKQNQ